MNYGRNFVTNTTEHIDEQQPGSAGESKEMGALQALWDLFSSMKTAIVLLLVLAAVSIVITIFNAKRGDDSSRVYQSPWYLFLLALIGVNLAVCSVNRFQQAWRRTFSPSLRADPKALKNAAASVSLTFEGTADAAAEKAEQALRARRYTVTKTQQDSAVVLHAVKGRLAIWGPYLTHLSILVIFLGAVIGGRAGFDGYMQIVEGQQTSTYSNNKIGKDAKLGFEVGLKKFEIKYDEKHNPTGYKSDLQVYDGGKQVAQKIIDVNHPLSYKGITFFQSSYGLESVTLTVTGPNGESKELPYQVQTGSENGQTVYSLIGMNEMGMAVETVNFGGKKLTVLFHNIAPDYVGGTQTNASDMPLHPAVQVYVNERFPEYKGMDAWKEIGWLPVNKSLTYKGYTIAFDRIVQYTGLSVARNPGLPVVYLGFALLVLGVFISFYLTHRIIRVHIATSGNKQTVVAGATSRADPSTFEKDWARLRDEVEA